jgi:hypothetical protein
MDSLLIGAALIRLGQELGTDSTAARAIHDLLDLVAALPWNVL